MADELSDADVMQPGELSDAEVSKPAGRQGGLLQAPGELLHTIPQSISALGNPEQRAKIPGAIYQATVQPILDAFTPHPEGQTPEQEVEQAFGLATIFELGRSRPFLKPSAAAIAPVAKEFNDTVAAPAAQRVDSFARTGDPNGVRLEPQAPETKQTPIQPIEGAPFAGVPRSVLAKTGDPVVDAVLFDPTVKAVIDNPVVDRSHTIPYEAGGSVPLNRPTTYIDKNVPQTFTVSRLSDPSKKITFDTAEPTAIHENAEEAAMDIMTKGGMSSEAAYRVAHFTIAEPAEHAWYRNNDIDPAAAEAEWKKLQPGIQREIANDTPADLYVKEYPGADVTKARHEQVFESGPTPEEVSQGMQILRDHYQGITAYHGTAAEVAFEPNFDVNEGTNIGEHGVSFFSRRPEAANIYAETNARARARVDAALDKLVAYEKEMKEKYGTTEWRPKATMDERQNWMRLSEAVRTVREPPEGAPGPRIIPVKIRPGNTQTFDVAKLLGESDKEFLEAYHETYTNPDLGHAPRAYKNLSQAERDENFRQRLEEQQRQYREHEKTRARILEETKNEEGGPHDIGPWEGHLDLIAPVIELAKKRGLDTARIINLAEHGEQIIVLNKNNINPFFSTKEMLQEARNLGVIGPEKPNINKQPPRAAAMQATNDSVIKGEVGGEQSPWRKRWESTLDKMETPQQARDVISRIVDAHDEFEQARQGPMPLSQIDALADVTGLDPKAIDQAGTGAMIKSNAQIRNVIEAFRTISDKIKQTAVDLAAKGGKDDDAEIAELTRLQMQRELLMSEAVTPTKELVALRAEFGRIGNTLQDYMKIMREAGDTNRFTRERTGHTKDDIREMGKMIAATPAEDLPKALESMRKDTMGPIYWTWVQGLISGWLTHSKYFLANELMGWMEQGATTPLAAVIGKVKQLSGVDTDRVFFGETAAGLWGHISSVPAAMYATGKVIKAGTRVPLDDEIELYRAGMKRNAELKAQGIKTEPIPLPLKRLIESSGVPSNPRAVTGEFLSKVTEPAVGKAAADKAGYMWSRFLGSPGDVASGIHTFYKIRGRWAAMEALAYRKAMEDGLDPKSAEFWESQRNWAANPTDEMRAQAVEDAYKSTFMERLDPALSQLSSAIRKNPVLKWVFPFMHIPLNILGAIQEHSPLALASSEFRDAILGRKGGIEQDKAIARVMVGSSIMGYFYHKYMMGQATGEMPNDQKERTQWIAEGKEPNSLLVGDRWISVNRFGVMGSLAQFGANFGHAVKTSLEIAKTGEYDQALLNFGSELALAAAHIATDEVGFQTLQYGFEAWTDNLKWQEFIGQEASSFIPFSSAVGQTAQLTDPYMRKIGGMWDALKYRIPGLRETLPVKQDVFGPVANPQYHSLLREREAVTDPVRLEMSRLGVNPRAPQQYIGKVKLTPEQFTQYQGTAAPLTHRLLDALVKSPGYAQMPDGEKAKQMHDIINYARAKARAAVQMQNPALVQQGIEARRIQIRGTP